MAFPYGRGRLNPTGHGVNYSQGQRPRDSLTNGSSSRKYTGKNLVINNPTDDLYSSNSEHVVNVAAGLKSSAISTQAIVDQARIDLANVRNQLLNVPSIKPGDVRIPGQAFDEHDLKVQQQALTARVQAAIGEHPVPTVNNKLKRNSQGIIQHALYGAFFPNEKGRGSSVNSHAPKIDHIRVDVQYKKGIHDVFFATMVYDIPVAGIHSGDIAAVRIFRATVDDPQLGLRPRLSVQGAERLRSDIIRTRAKNQDYLGNYEQVLRELGIDNAITALNPFDPTRKRRVGKELDSITALDHHAAVDNQTSRDRNVHDLASWIHPQSFLNVDRSVITNLKAIRNLQLQNPDLAHREIDTGVRVGANMYRETAGRVRGEHVRQTRSQFNNQSPFLIDNGNKLEFKEVTVISAKKLEGNLIGDVFESYYVDRTVTYGKQYLYYILTVDKNMAQSQRSQIVSVTVDGYRHPGGVESLQGFPINNAINLSMTCFDLLVEKFEIYRKELTGTDHPDQAEIRVHGAGGYHTSRQIVTRLQNGFLKIGESINNGKDGGTFYDRNARPGHRYVYRVLTVDVFGNRNSEAKELEVFYPEATKHIHLAKPTIKVDLDTKTNKTRVHMHCDDTNVIALFLKRRDITIGQQDFVVPGSPERLKQGGGEATGHLHLKADPVIGPTTDRALSWNGYFDIRNERDVLFIDKTSQIDHTYQYQVYGIDKFGNITAIEQSGRVTVVDIAQVDAPKNLVGSVETDGNGNLTGVRLRWEDAMINFAAEDQLGNQEDLRETSVRTLFQVERRMADEDQWHSFPMVSTLDLFDPARPPQTPLPVVAPLYPVMHPNNYQSRQLLRTYPTHLLAAQGPKYVPNPSLPPPVEVNKTYIYRIQAFQSGGFVSNFSPNIAVTVVLPVSDPVGFSAKLATGNTNVRPVNVVVQWTTPADSGPVDYWVIERALVNVYAAGNFSNANPDDLAKIQYVPFRTVHLESQQNSSHVPGMIAPKGYHYITDMDVPLGNMVFYRIRAHASVGGSVSNWIYTAFKLRDSAYEAKQAAIAAEEERKRLAAEWARAHPPPPIVYPKPAPPSSFSFVPSHPIVTHPATFVFRPLGTHLERFNTVPPIRYTLPPAARVVGPPPASFARAPAVVAPPPAHFVSAARAVAPPAALVFKTNFLRFRF